MLWWRLSSSIQVVAFKLLLLLLRLFLLLVVLLLWCYSRQQHLDNHSQRRLQIHDRHKLW
jgi:hypothetical protein